MNTPIEQRHRELVEEIFPRAYEALALYAESVKGSGK